MSATWATSSLAKDLGHVIIMEDGVESSLLVKMVCVHSSYIELSITSILIRGKYVERLLGVP